MTFHKIMMIFSIFLIFSAARSQEFKLLTPTVLDLGTVPSDTIVEDVIRFKNSGDAPLRIKNIRTSCGCTVVEPRKMVYQPGEEGALTVRFNTKGYSGTTRKSINIYLEEGNPSNIRVLLQASVKPQIEIVPRFINFQEISLGQKVVRKSFRVGNNTRRMLVAKSLRSDNPDLKIEPTQFTLPPDSSQTIRVSYTPQKVGRKNSLILLDVVKPFKSEQRIPVFVNVVP